jgi:hypothetical protein
MRSIEQQAIDQATLARSRATPWHLASEHSAGSVAIMSRLL